MDKISLHITPLNDNLDNLIYDNFQEYTKNYKKMNIYNANIDKPLQKIWFVTSKLKMNGKIYFSDKQQHSALLSLFLYGEEGVTLRKFIKKLEKKIHGIINDDTTKKIKLRSCIKKTNKFYSSIHLQLPYSKKDDNIYFNFNIFNDKNEKINYKDVDSGSLIKVYVEVSDVWISKKEFGINLKVLQMKVYPEFDFLNECLFDDYNFIEDDKSKQNKNLPLPPPPPPVKNSHKPKELNNNSIKAFVPTINDLMSVKLKPIINSSNNNPNPNPDPEIQEVPSPPPEVQDDPSPPPKIKNKKKKKKKKLVNKN